MRGARQVGKTFLLEAFGRPYFEAVLTVNLEPKDVLHRLFEGMEPQRLIQELGLSFNQSIVPGQTLLLLDEVQACPKALACLRYFQEQLADRSGGVPSRAVCRPGTACHRPLLRRTLLVLLAPGGENTGRIACATFGTGTMADLTVLFADDLDQDALAAAAVELAVEDLLPRAEVELAIGDGDHHFPAHDLALEVGVGVVLVPVMAVL